MVDDGGMEVNYVEKASLWYCGKDIRGEVQVRQVSQVRDVGERVGAGWVEFERLASIPKRVLEWRVERRRWVSHALSCKQLRRSFACRVGQGNSAGHLESKKKQK
jgi:hypothetical protein